MREITQADKIALKQTIAKIIKEFEEATVLAYRNYSRNKAREQAELIIAEEIGATICRAAKNTVD